MLWIKAFHIIFMVTWFAGLFYLPRLFVYHADATDEIGHQRFCVMERKLFAIMTIGGIGTAVFGLWLLIGWLPGLLALPWMHIKLTLVAGLIAYHLYLGVIVKRFAARSNERGHVFYRWINEAPALALIAIVILVIVRPFQ